MKAYGDKLVNLNGFISEINSPKYEEKNGIKMPTFFLGFDDEGVDVPGGSLTWEGIVMTTKQL